MIYLLDQDIEKAAIYKEAGLELTLEGGNP